MALFESWAWFRNHSQNNSKKKKFNLGIKLRNERNQKINGVITLKKLMEEKQKNSKLE